MKVLVNYLETDNVSSYIRALHCVLAHDHNAMRWDKFKKLVVLLPCSWASGALRCGSNNVIHGTNLAVKLDMYFFHLTIREIQICFHSSMANSKRKLELLCGKLSSCLKYMEVRTALRLFLWFYFVALSGAGPNGLVRCNF